MNYANFWLNGLKLRVSNKDSRIRGNGLNYLYVQSIIIIMMMTRSNSVRILCIIQLYTVHRK